MSFRFRPPTVASTPELSWVLLRAFGPATAAAPEGIDLAAALGLAETLEVTPRIGAWARAFAELASAPAVEERLARASQGAAATELRARELTLEIAAVARAIGVPCCLLKGAALAARGLLTSGSRALGDVDLLVPEREAPAFAAALARRGFREDASEGYPHQLPGLAHPVLGLVEVHRHLPGMSSPGARRFATFEDLDAAGLLVAAGDAGDGVFLPRDAALLAHLLAHGLAQHGFQPGAYPALRLVGDLIDLGLAGDRGDELLRAALPWIDRWIPIEEAQAAAVLCRRLAAGDTTWGDDDAGLLLRHFLAGRLDARYAEALKLVQLAHPLTAATGLARFWHTAKGLLVLSHAQVDMVYGKPRSRWGYLGRRLLRPFDLVLRGARAAWAAARR